MSELELFTEALSRADDGERAAYLDTACGTAGPLRERIDQLLALHAEQASLLDLEPAALLGELAGGYGGADISAAVAGRPVVQPGLAVGPYLLVEKIGEGGMGEVWVARQTAPVRRKVALKLLKPGLDSRAVLARFEQERQALALMDHPNIARVLDAGMGPTGLPYFVMELVNGLPLTRYCDEARLTPRARLELMVPICQAVQHAHQKGIIHRDLKPANILVTQIDGRPVPKVIDFGVAKATLEKLTEETVSTLFGGVVGTIDYMAPEQAGFSGVDVDTRADIYSLGVLLYELLTGLRPTDGRLRKGAAHDTLRALGDEEPVSPSTRLSTADSLPALASLRQTEPRQLMAMLRGELDWVVMKCLERQRDRRYETANGLARDIERFLADQPVEARPPSAAYRVRKFLSRHRRSVAVAGLLLLVLVGGAAGTAIGLWHAAQARQAEREASARAEKRQAQVEQSVAVLALLFEDLDPQHGDRRPLPQTLADRLKQAVDRLAGDSVGDPQIIATLQSRVGAALINLGDPAAAVPLLEQALATFGAVHGPDHPTTYGVTRALSVARFRTGQRPLALRQLEDAIARARARLDPAHPVWPALLHTLGRLYLDAGRPDHAGLPLDEALAWHRDHPGHVARDLATLLLTLGEVHFQLRRFEQAEAHYRAAVDGLRADLGPIHPRVLTAQTNLAWALQELGRLDEAEQLLRHSADNCPAQFGPSHPETFTCRLGLAVLDRIRGRFDRALAALRAAQPEVTRLLGADHRHAYRILGEMGIIYKESGRVEEGIPLLEQASHGARKYPELAYVHRHLVDAYVKSRRFSEAARLAAEFNLETGGPFGKVLRNLGKMLPDGPDGK